MVLQSKRIGRFFMIGVYDYTVIATYLSLLLGAWRPLFRRAKRASRRHAVPDARGLLDAFDGRIARTKKDRTEQEKRFGIQIDSLNDLVWLRQCCPPPSAGAWTAIDSGSLRRCRFSRSARSSASPTLT